jgi:hypothetical protein
LQIANAIEVLPVPDGPTNSQALAYGFSTNFAKIFFGFSNPTNCAMVLGWYRSASDCGNGNAACPVNSV